MPELPHGRFPGPAPPAELLRGWGRPRDVFGGSWGGASARGEPGKGGVTDRTVSPAHPSPSHARGLRGVVSSGRFEKARGGRGRGQGPERRACSDWPGAPTRFSSLGPGPRPFWVRCCVSCSAGVKTVSLLRVLNFQLLKPAILGFLISLGCTRIMTLKKIK